MKNSKLVNLSTDIIKGTITGTFLADSGKSFIRTVAESDARYAKIDKLIEAFNKNELSRDEFSDKVSTIILSTDFIGMKSTIMENQFISAHLQIKNNHFYVDNMLVSGPLEKQLIKLFAVRDSTEHDTWLSFVHFTEKLYNNTSESVRNQLYGWITYQIDNGALTLTKSGDFIAYKGGDLDKDTNLVYSCHRGHGFVNGKEYKDSYLPNKSGDIVEIPRNEVDTDPSSPCSFGLHVGTWDYASSFAETVLLVQVNPADVVSVPSDYNNQKIRTCRYQVLRITDKQLENILFDEVPDDLDTETKLQPGAHIDNLSYKVDGGETRHYEDVEVEYINNDVVTIKLSNGEYRSLRLQKVFDVGEADNQPEFSGFDLNTHLKEFWYHKDNGETRHYYDADIVDVDDEFITVELNNGEYRKLRLKNVFDVVTDTKPVTPQDDNKFSMGQHVKTLSYLKDNGDVRYYAEVDFITIQKGLATVQLSNGEYRTLRLTGIFDVVEA